MNKPGRSRGILAGVATRGKRGLTLAGRTIFVCPPKGQTPFTTADPFNHGLLDSRTRFPCWNPAVPIQNLQFIRLVLLLAVVAATLSQGISHAQARVSPVVVSPVAERTTATAQTFVGTVLPVKKSAVGSAVDGRVVEYPINEGDRVTKGQPLAILLTETIKLSIVAAEGELKLRKEELAEMVNGWRKEEILQSAAQMEVSRARRDYAIARFKRTASLVEKGQSGTLDQMEEDRATSTAAEQQYESDRLALELMKQGHRPEKIEQSRAKVAEQEAIVEQLRDQLKKHTMIAPFDGYIVAERTEVGEWVTRGQVVAEVIYLDEVDVEAHVLDTQIEHVRIGAPVRVEIPALKTTVFVGEVKVITPQADVRSRTFPVKVRIKNVIRDDGPLLKAGMLARAALPTGEQRQSILVPKDAIVLGGQSPMVWVVVPTDEADLKGVDPKGPQPSGKVRPVPVEMGVADGNWIAINGPLKADQQVVVVGNERLQPGQLISIIEIQKPPVTEAVLKGDEAR
ncbi:MAG: efflux RND transporter periplasmic adaptor subunit [Planctomycetes bacterium]|nr:efflux RND transporter periplasmic adaptor subunit [Planctomycetota bacterium]